MGNTVGNSSVSFCNFQGSNLDAYALGLWCADGYHRTSSIGLSNINPKLISWFSKFLADKLAKERLKLKVYTNERIKLPNDKFGIADISVHQSNKAKNVAYHVYVNCRPLLREFVDAKNKNKNFYDPITGWNYLAGRFDGDGTIGKDLRRDLRISYTTKVDAENDIKVLKKLDIVAKLYWYRTSHTFVVYVPRAQSIKFVSGCLPFSIKLQKLTFESRRDLALSEAKPDNHTL